MGLKVITPPSQVITTAELVAHLRTELGIEDALIVGCLDGARALAEHYAARAIGQQTLELALDAFPCGAIELPMGPVASITSITYLNAAGGSTVLSSAAYSLDDYRMKPRAVPAAATSWPATYAAVNAVKVRY